MNVVEVHEFPVQSELTAEIITIPPVAMNPSNILVTGDKLVMFNMKKDTIFDVFRLPDCSYMFSAGYKGEGPNDFQHVDRRSFVPTSTGFKVYFQDSQVLKDILLDDYKMEVNRGNDKKFQIDQNPVNGFLALNDSVYLYWSGMGKDTEYDLLNYNTNQTTAFSFYPQWRGKDETDDKIFTYVKNSVASPSGDKFASFYGYFKHICIYDYQGALLKDISVTVPPMNSTFEPNPEDRTIYYYAYPKTVGEYIYTLCRNGKRGDGGNIEFQVWKWDGTPAGRYKISDEITLFAISEKDKKIYAVDGENEEKLYVYPLPVY